jgi:hypothetical protein
MGASGWVDGACSEVTPQHRCQREASNGRRALHIGALSRPHLAGILRHLLNGGNVRRQAQLKRAAQAEPCVSLDGSPHGRADALPVALTQPRVAQGSDERQVHLKRCQLLARSLGRGQRGARQLLKQLCAAAPPPARAATRSKGHKRDCVSASARLRLYWHTAAHHIITAQQPRQQQQHAHLSMSAATASATISVNGPSIQSGSCLQLQLHSSRRHSRAARAQA